MGDYSPEAREGRLETLAECVADGWPVTEIIATHGFSQQTIRKYHPEYGGLSREDRDIITGLKRQIYSKLRKKGLMRKGETL